MAESSDNDHDRPSASRPASPTQRIVVPGGWIYMVSGQPVLVSDPVQWTAVDPRVDQILAVVNSLSDAMRTRVDEATTAIQELTAIVTTQSDVIDKLRTGMGQLADLHELHQEFAGQISKLAATIPVNATPTATS